MKFFLSRLWNFPLDRLQDITHLRFPLVNFDPSESKYALLLLLNCEGSHYVHLSVSFSKLKLDANLLYEYSS